MQLIIHQIHSDKTKIRLYFIDMFGFDDAQFDKNNGPYVFENLDEIKLLEFCQAVHQFSHSEFELVGYKEYLLRESLNWFKGLTIKEQEFVKTLASYQDEIFN